MVATGCIVQSYSPHHDNLDLPSKSGSLGQQELAQGLVVFSEVFMYCVRAPMLACLNVLWTNIWWWWCKIRFADRIMLHWLAAYLRWSRRMSSELLRCWLWRIISIPRYFIMCTTPFTQTYNKNYNRCATVITNWHGCNRKPRDSRSVDN